MPNYCNFEMKVTGTKENVEEFIRVINADYYIDKDGHCDCDRHFWRIFEADVFKESFENNYGYIKIDGYCAWSVYSCMCDGEDTYNEISPNGGGTSLQKESEILNLTIEVFSVEPGLEFVEHFLFINGKWVINECVEYKEYDTLEFENVKELNAEYGTNFTQEEFEENDVLYIGGIPWIYDTWNI